MREFLQSNSSSPKKAREGRGVQMWEVGFWLHWQLWGTAVFQSRKWLDLPCGRRTHPSNSPHCFEHLGSPQAPTEGSRATADRQGRENLLVQAARTLEGAVSPRRNKTQPRTWLRPLKRFVSLSFKTLWPITARNDCIAQQEVDQADYLLKKKKEWKTVDCNNRTTLHVVYVYYVDVWITVGI